MVRQITATEAKAKFLALLKEIEQGEEVEITRRGKVVARIAPARGKHRLMGMHAGQVFSSSRDEDLFSTGETWNAM
jgi:prevent-host-death family protein